MTGDHDLAMTAESGRRSWDRLHANPGFAPRYPNEHVIRWVLRHFPRERAPNWRLLDAGAGAGRHGLLFARFGYHSTLIDFSAVGMADARAQAEGEGLDLRLAVAAAERLPFADASFDGVLSYGVIYYLPWPAMQAAVAEIHRVLRPGGKALVVIKSDQDSRGRHGEPVGEHGYRLERTVEGMSWAKELGMTLTLLDRPGVETCFAGFAELLIDTSTVTLGNGRFQDQEWLIQLTR